jgi:hypothetical protein
LHKRFDVTGGDSVDRQTSETSPDVLQATLITVDGALLLWRSAPHQYSPSIEVLVIGSDELAQGQGMALGVLISSRITTSNDLSEQLQSSSPRLIGRPWAAMPANREPSLPILLRSVKQTIGDAVQVSSGVEASQIRIPDAVARLTQCSHRGQRHSLALFHVVLL